MVIVYCDKCGRRVNDGDLAAGRAAKLAENKWLCSACVPASASAPPKPAPTRATTGVLVKTVSARRSGPVPTPKAAEPQTVPPAMPAPNRLTIALVAGGALLLLAGIALLCTGGGGDKATAGKPGETSVSSMRTPRTPESSETRGSASTPGSVTGPASPATTSGPAAAPVTQSAPAASPGADPPPDAKALSLAERARQAEKEMQDFRNQRAAKLLEDHKAWFKQNPADPWT